MSNPIPLQHGKYYHIYNRGNNRENIFFEERNYRYFLQLYAKYIQPIADTYAYCLLYNHFHVLVRIKSIEELQNHPEMVPQKQVSRSQICSTPMPGRSTRHTVAAGHCFNVLLGASRSPVKII
jgi:REP element-mobilizing transposase RayT